MERFTTPTTDAPHELAAAVNLIQKAGLVTEKFDYAFWLKQVKNANYDHPEEEIKRLIKKMWDVKAWLTSKGELMQCGGWLTNRLKEQARGPQPRQ